MYAYMSSDAITGLYMVELTAVYALYTCWQCIYCNCWSVYLIESVSFLVRAASDDRLNTPSVVMQPRSSRACGSAVCSQHSIHINTKQCTVKACSVYYHSCVATTGIR
jgi:hypothetical protein